MIFFIPLKWSPVFFLLPYRKVIGTIGKLATLRPKEFWIIFRIAITKFKKMIPKGVLFHLAVFSKSKFSKNLQIRVSTKLNFDVLSMLWLSPERHLLRSPNIDV